MKKILILLFITAALDCSAATGSASDAADHRSGLPPVAGL